MDVYSSLNTIFFSLCMWWSCIKDLHGSSIILLSSLSSTSHTCNTPSMFNRSSDLQWQHWKIIISVGSCSFILFLIFMKLEANVFDEIIVLIVLILKGRNKLLSILFFVKLTLLSLVFLWCVVKSKSCQKVTPNFHSLPYIAIPTIESETVQGQIMEILKQV